MNRPAHLIFACMAALIMISCQTLSEESTDEITDAKSRGEWSSLPNFPNAQDIAILVPRDADIRIAADNQNQIGERLLPEDWIEFVSDAFLDTPVEDAFTLENWYGDWQVASIRIAPCGPLLKTPGSGNDLWCWPEVRLVWQPTQYDVSIRGVYQSAYSDDRAMHVLYDVLPRGDSEEASTLLAQARNGIYSDPARFEALRNQAITELLDRMARLRSDQTRQSDTVSYRGELVSDDAVALSFLEQFLSEFGDVMLLGNVHTVTAFSLPEGRQPAGIDLWSFLAFEASEGILSQKSIEIVDPATGMVVGELDSDETVTSARADDRLEDQMNTNTTGDILQDQVLRTEDDRSRIGDRINDPRQTLVPNTSCATCHSFNELVFDFHNLSFLEGADITIAPRVKADVEAELDWLRAWIDRI